MIDIREGDILVVSGKDYPVRSAQQFAWSSSSMTMSRMLSETASTKRSSTSGGKVAQATTYLTNVKVSPMYPVNADLITTAELDTPSQSKVCFAGDNTGFVQMIVEDLKR